MTDAITLTSISKKRGGKNFVARINGRGTGRAAWNYDFLGEDAAVGEPGLYVERDIDFDGDRTDTFHVFDGGRTAACDAETASLIAEQIDKGGDIDWRRWTATARLATANRALDRAKTRPDDGTVRYRGLGPDWGEDSSETVTTWREYRLVLQARIERFEAELASDPREAAVAQARELISRFSLTVEELGL